MKKQNLEWTNPLTPVQTISLADTDEYRRNNDSARKHTSGRTINEHLNEIETYLLIVGNTPDAVLATKEMEPVFIQYYSPPWNKQFN